jgi:hypothetical protein
MLSADTIRARVRERLAEQRRVVGRLLRLREQLGGSLFARYGVCGKPSCACRSGRKHGPYLVLSTRSGGKGDFAYLDGRQARDARGLVTRHREYRRGMRRLKRVNEELVELLKRYQTATTRQATVRLGLPLAR